MTESTAEKNIQTEREKKWKMASIPRMRQIVPGLFLGNVQSSWNLELLKENHIKAMISLADGRWVWWNSVTRETVPEHQHKWVQCADSTTQNLLVHMSDTCDFIDQLAFPALSSLDSLPIEQQHAMDDKPEAILIHCDLGISRSPTIIIAYLMRKLRIPLMEALEFVKSKQSTPRVKPSRNFTRQLQVWEEVGYQIWENEEKTVPKPPYKAFLDDRAALLKKKGLTEDEPLAPLSLLD
ncbi:Dual specificity phosphatase [Penicillium italicum]|uniref:protein-tyrosine-phosphatase n=1 Tax=Penicillium italicum TaxID=40296 RepID=A0A0A2L3Z5_PENIT|nr:Dual specificity phosphatase [Penicillium italicum]